jgi:hypothetical protein
MPEVRPSSKLWGSRSHTPTPVVRSVSSSSSKVAAEVEPKLWAAIRAFALKGPGYYHLVPPGQKPFPRPVHKIEVQSLRNLQDKSPDTRPPFRLNFSGRATLFGVSEQGHASNPWAGYRERGRVRGADYLTPPTTKPSASRVSRTLAIWSPWISMVRSFTVPPVLHAARNIFATFSICEGGK